MDASLLDILAAPQSGLPLRLNGDAIRRGSRVESGRLTADDGTAYLIHNGIPRFVLTADDGQLQTQSSFDFKWRGWGTSDSPGAIRSHRQWLAERYGFDDPHAMKSWFASRRRILDAGCGSGFSSSCWLDESWRSQSRAEWVGLDISGAIDIARERLGDVNGTHFVQGDVLDPPFAGGVFDTIFSEGVLHHTPSTGSGLRALARLLSDDGRLMFYVYRRKGPIREFTDDYVRQQIAELPHEQASKLLEPLTLLARALAELNAEVEVPCDVPLLGIKAGRQNVQRLIYWNMAKLFWNPEFTFEENHLVNFDWYHPQYAHRHTEAEIRAWCDECGLVIHRFCEQDSGYTVIAGHQ